MSKQSNPTIIGAFVVGAIALLAIGVTLFGGAQYFAPKSEMVTYFDGSVKGLRVGSNVLFRGVRIGFVKDVQLVGDIGTLQPAVRATLEMTPEAWLIYKDGEVLDAAKARNMVSSDQLLKAGLRARLGTESFVTGQLVVELDFFPDTEPVLRGIKEEKLPEIPSIPTNIEQLLARLQQFAQEIDFDELARRVESILKGVDELVNSPDARTTLAGISQFTSSEDFQQIPTELRSALAEIRSAAGNLGELASSVGTEVAPLSAELKTTLSKVDTALDAATKTLDDLDRQINGDTGLDTEVSSTLKEVRDTARSLRVLTDYLQNNPEALLRGKR